MPLVEKILNKPAGETVNLEPDWCMINDGDGHICVELIDGARGIARPDKVIVILDHDIPAGSFDSAANQKKLIEFSRRYDLPFVQSAGIGYQILLENHLKGGNVIVSCGKHTGYLGAKGALGVNLGVEAMAELIMAGSLSFEVPKTARIELKGTLPTGTSAIDLILTLLSDAGENGFGGMVVEFTGEALENMTLNDRIVLCSMASQTGAVSAFVNEEPSGKYANAIEYDVSSTRPIVTLPGSLYQSKKVEELKGVAINAAFIGGCMGGRIEDVRIAADILKGKRIKLGVRLMVGFASNAVYLQAAEEGLIDIFMDSGAQVTNPGCGSCQTTSIGVVGDGEVLITTGSHNHPGCAGTEDSSVYIASAATVATAALNGYIRSGEE
jgi:3-isopropylmalate/(R)-2-methylmalate dehydratase large subunit